MRCLALEGGYARTLSPSKPASRHLVALNPRTTLTLFMLSQKKMKVSVIQSSPTLCDPMDCSPPGSSVHGILQARILEWVAISFSRGSSCSRDQTRVFHIAGRFFIIWATREQRKPISSLSWCSTHKFRPFSSAPNPYLVPQPRANMMWFQTRLSLVP